MTKARECGSKQKHATKAKAEEHRWALVRSGSRPAALSIYKCKFCGSWHVGHSSRR